ncbi:MAG: hypothetical protein JWP83_2939 [Mycobacterium sp.]|uniref:PE family protein n=1 Tax=Mycobacterium sp. TaxID=1785 RepID=UPI00345C1670|nr:hypothetical protein [Mycobacterium sp.]
MSSLNVLPEIVSAVSGNLQNLGSALRNANAEAASQTTAIAAPAADEVSWAISAALRWTRGPRPCWAIPRGDRSGRRGRCRQFGCPVHNNLGAIYVSYPFGPFGLSISEGPTSISDGMGGFLTNRDYRKWRRDPKHSVCFRASQLTAGSWDTYFKPGRLVHGYRSTRPGSFSHIPYPPD